MKTRIVGLFVVAFALILVMGICTYADDMIYEGTVVKVEDDTLTVTGKGKKESSHTVPKDAKVSCDGKACKLSDLKPGYTVKVTVEKKGGKDVITKVEGKKK